MLFGSALVEFALAWYLTIKTGSATVLATATLVALLPQIVLGPLVGPYIDRWNRKQIMIWADLGIAVITAGLIILFLTGTVQVWHVYFAMVVRAVGQTFHFPAEQAAIPMIVEEKNLARAAGLNQMLQGAISIAAPPAGALFLGIMPVEYVLAIDIGTALIAVCILLPLTIPQPARAAAAVKFSAFKDMLEGFRYIGKWGGLKLIMIFSALFNLFMIPAFVLLPVLVTSHLEGDVLKLGWLESAFGIGIITGGLILGAWGGFKRKMTTVMAGIFISSIAVGFLGVTSVDLFYIGLGASFLVGFGLSGVNAPIMAVFQAVIAKNMQGRVFSLLGSISAAVTPLGLAFAGPLADAVGIRYIYYISGAVCLILAVITSLIPSVMNIEKLISESDASVGTRQPGEEQVKS